MELTRRHILITAGAAVASTATPAWARRQKERLTITLLQDGQIKERVLVQLPLVADFEALWGVWWDDRIAALGP